MPFLSTLGGGSARGFNPGSGVSTLGLSQADPAVSAKAILDAHGGTAPNGDGLYWITVNGTARQVYCDMTSPAANTGSNPGGWMMTYKVDANGFSSCGNGTWDLHVAANYGGSAPPLTPYGAITNGAGEGLSYGNRYAFWTSGACPNSQVLMWCGRASLDLKIELVAAYDTQNHITGFAYGLPNQITSGNSYFNNTTGTNAGRVRYTSGYQTNLTVGSDYQIYLLGGWQCNCCESFHLNGNWDANSTDISMIFGDGLRANAQPNQRDFTWCAFFVR